MRVFSGLLFLSALASIKASEPNGIQGLTSDFGNLVIADKSGKDYSSLGFAGVMQIGEQLKEEALKARATLKDIVKMLDDEMGRIMLFVNKAEVISWITQIFVCFDDIYGIYTYDDLHEIALEENAKNFLSASIAFNHCETFEEFLPFLISSYKSNWYHEEFWTGHKVNWSKVELRVILFEDKPKFLEDFLSNQLPFTTHHSLSNDQVLDLVVRHDFLDIFNHYKTLGIVTFEQLHKRIGKLIQFGSVKLLRALYGITGKNLNLQDYFTSLEKLPKHPEDWEFLKAQGYQYMPVDKILNTACRGGQIYILREFYEISEKLIPTIFDLEEAAKRGHWDTIKWAINNGISKMKGRFLFFAILNGHFEFIQFFESEYNFKIDLSSTTTKELYGPGFLSGTSVVQILANEATFSGKSKVVEWISDKFNILPEKDCLCEATIRMLKLLKLKKPEIFDADLLKRIDHLSSIEWMWPNYGDLFTDEIKKKWTNGYRNGKELRWIHKNWKMLPQSVGLDVSVEDLELFIKVTGREVDIFGVAERAVKEGNSEKVKFLIAKYPSYLKVELVSTAMAFGHAGIVNMLDKHFEHQFVDIQSACTYGYFEILKQSLVGGGASPDSIKWGVIYGIRNDHLEIVEYMINEGHTSADQVPEYMWAAIMGDSIRIFELLIKKFGGYKLSKNALMDCWVNGSFKIFKFSLPKLSKSELEMLLERWFDKSNYHLRIIAKEEYEKRTQGV